MKEYELLRKNFSDSGNFGEQQTLLYDAAGVNGALLWVAHICLG